MCRMTIFDNPASQRDLSTRPAHRLSAKNLRGTSAIHCSLAPRPGSVWREIKLKPMDATLEVANILSVGLATLRFMKEPRTKYFTLTQWESSQTLESFKLDLVTGRLRCITKQFSGKIFWPKDFVMKDGEWRTEAGRRTFFHKESYSFQDPKWHGLMMGDILPALEETMKLLPKRSSARTCLAILTDDLNRVINRDALIIR